MAEDVDKEEGFTGLGELVGLEPCRDLVKNCLVVLHVLHHLNRHHSIEAVHGHG